MVLSDEKTHEHSKKRSQKLKKPMSIAAKMKSTNLVPEDRRRKSYRSGHQRWETLLSRTPTQFRLARSLARTTRTRNETETDFTVGVNCVDYFPSTSDLRSVGLPIEKYLRREMATEPHPKFPTTLPNWCNS